MMTKAFAALVLFCIVATNGETAETVVGTEGMFSNQQYAFSNEFMMMMYENDLGQGRKQIKNSAEQDNQQSAALSVGKQLLALGTDMHNMVAETEDVFHKALEEYAKTGVWDLSKYLKKAKTEKSKKKEKDSEMSEEVFELGEGEDASLSLQTGNKQQTEKEKAKEKKEKEKERKKNEKEKEKEQKEKEKEEKKLKKQDEVFTDGPPGSRLPWVLGNGDRLCVASLELIQDMHSQYSRVDISNNTNAVRTAMCDQADHAEYSCCATQTCDLSFCWTGFVKPARGFKNKYLEVTIKASPDSQDTTPKDYRIRADVAVHIRKTSACLLMKGGEAPAQCKASKDCHSPAIEIKEIKDVETGEEINATFWDGSDTQGRFYQALQAELRLQASRLTSLLCSSV